MNIGNDRESMHMLKLVSIRTVYQNTKSCEFVHILDRAPIQQEGH